ncbi:MAG: MFS transporter [Chloroflexi bacterium]|nr:MFS transporter [Chloroflexota bacterium]
MKVATTLQRAAYPLAILRQRNFGLLWSSMAVSGTGMQMESLALAWLVLTRTDSPFLVGLIASARMALNFLALFSGAIADRLPRHLLVAAVLFIVSLLSLAMFALLVSDLLEVWHIFALVLVGGLVRLFQMPASQSLIGDILPADRLSNGAALTTMGMNLNTVVGPLIGGFLFQVIGPQGVYAVIVVLNALGGVLALFIRSGRVTSQSQEESVLRSMLEGLKYVKRNQVLWAILLLAVIINFTGWPLHTSLMPVFARDVLGTGSAGLGLLMSAFGIGALIGSVSLASVRDLKSAGKLLILSVVVWHASMLAFSASHSLYLSLSILLFTGMAFSSTQVTMLTVILKNTLPDFRGRILGMRSMAIYTYTFGSMNSGAIAETWGAPWAGRFNGVVGIVLVGVLALFTPKLREA